jgi:DMSO/TMAO reductase YedYZ molybdopterin-dependent catalytic subunit
MSEIDLMAPRADAPQAAPPRRLGALAGLVAGGIAVGSGMLVASVLDVVAPIDAVGSEFIDFVPGWLKRLAISWFGTQDKLALRIGIFVVMAVIAARVGIASLKARWIGAVGIAAFGLLGALIAIQRPGESVRAAFPSIVGAGLGIGVLWLLLDKLVGHWRADRMPATSKIPIGLDRRGFFVLAGAAGASAVVAGGVATASERRRIDDIQDSAPDALPAPIDEVGLEGEAGEYGGGSNVDGPLSNELNPVTPYITPNDGFYRIDTAFSLPRVDVDTWKMSITGMVDTPLEFTYADLLARPQIERTITIACVSNEVGGDLIGNAVWQGVRLKDLLDEAGVQSGAEQVYSTSVDGWTCGFPVEVAMDGRDALVALGMNGEPLPLLHGFPVRLIVPGIYGYVSATKWLENIKLTTWAEEEGYWIPRGWSRDAPVKTHSRIDLPRRRDELVAGEIEIAGVAWAQHRGVAKVEVRVDDGEWREARLSDDITDDAWKQWAYTWPDATSGEHLLQVRATDKDGETQTAEVARVDPNGATGYHTRKINVA